MNSSGSSCSAFLSCTARTWNAHRWLVCSPRVPKAPLGFGSDTANCCPLAHSSNGGHASGTTGWILPADHVVRLPSRRGDGCALRGGASMWTIGFSSGEPYMGSVQRPPIGDLRDPAQRRGPAGLAFAPQRACWRCRVRRDRRSKLAARLVRSGQAARPGAPSGVRSFRGPLGYPKVKTYASTPGSRNATSNVRSVIDPCSRTS
jgi:hypothetical protein